MALDSHVEARLTSELRELRLPAPPTETADDTACAEEEEGEEPQVDCCYWDVQPWPFPGLLILAGRPTARGAAQGAVFFGREGKTHADAVLVGEVVGTGQLLCTVAIWISSVALLSASTEQV